MPSRDQCLTFGPFEFDTEAQQLRHSGLRVRLSASQLRLLKLFLERPNQLITRAEIIECLWSEPGVVDTENGINTAVNRLRKSLNDDSGAPRYIETVVGLGYRFLVEVSVSQRRELATALAHEQVGRRGPEELAALSPPAVEPSFSADFSERLSAASPTPPTYSPAKSGWAALLAVTAGVLALVLTASFFWERSQTRTPNASLFLPVSMSLNLVLFEDENSEVLATAVSPDSQHTAHSDASGIWIYGNGPQTERRIASPPDLRAHHLGWLADNKQLLVSGTSAGNRDEVWLASLGGAAPRLLLGDATMATASPAADVYAFLRSDGHQLWTSELGGQHLRSLSILAAGESFGFLVWSPNGKWLIAQHRDASQKWHAAIIDPSAGRVVDQKAGLRYGSAFLLRDGRLFFPEASGQTSSYARLMVQAVDLDRGRFLGEPQAVDKFQAPEIQSLSGSADGSRVAAIERRKYASVLTADVTRDPVKLEHLTDITPYSIGNYPHAWSPTGDAVVLENQDLLNSGIYEERADGSRLTLLAQLPADAAMGEFTPDGRWILFVGLPKVTPWPYGIFRVPASGGTPEQLRVPGNINEFHCSIAAIGRCVLLETAQDGGLVFYALDPLKGIGKKLRTLPKQETVLGDWSISPDGKTIALADHDPLHPRVRLIGLEGSTEILDLPVNGFGSVLEPTWDPAGTGFYVECMSENGYVLLHVTFTGKTTLLEKSYVHIWGVPSRDGKKLAFPSVETKSTLWIGSIQP